MKERKDEDKFAHYLDNKKNLRRINREVFNDISGQGYKYGVTWTVNYIYNRLKVMENTIGKKTTALLVNKILDNVSSERIKKFQFKQQSKLLPIIFGEKKGESPKSKFEKLTNIF